MPTESHPVSDTLTLAEQIDRQITATGPMSLSTYMRLCLTHPTLGYYKNDDPLGKAGDFITAPEISQMFGEFVGLFISNLWRTMGQPKRFNLVELGPGRGTLMQDAMRVIGRVEGLIDTIQLILVETNQTLIEAQRQKLATYNPQWITEIDELDANDDPLIVIANEFFDALPIKQYQKHQGKWHERAIGLRDGQRAWGLAPTPLPPSLLPAAVRDAKDGAVWESGQIGVETMSEIAKRLVKRGGALLAIDYGYDQTQTGDTFQAVAKHEFTDPLLEPGHADLTTHVDFEALSKAATDAGADAMPLLTQAQFLQHLGIDDRAAALAVANPELANEIRGARDRLVGEKQMGNLFKALAITAPDIVPYPFGTTTANEQS